MFLMRYAMLLRCWRAAFSLTLFFMLFRHYFAIIDILPFSAACYYAAMLTYATLFFASYATLYYADYHTRSAC